MALFLYIILSTSTDMSSNSNKGNMLVSMNRLQKMYYNLYYFPGTPASNRRECELRLHLNVVTTGAGVFKSRHILLHKYVNRIMITYLWCQIQLFFNFFSCPLVLVSRQGYLEKKSWIELCMVDQGLGTELSRYRDV
jgi:hypothetical protein